MFGDVIAHIVGEELKRGNPNLVPVTREKFVQNKLKELRRASGEINLCELREWANNQQLSQVCFVEAKAGGSNGTFSFTHAQQAYSAQLIDVAGNVRSCVAAFDFTRSGGGEMAPAELTKVAWEVVGRLQSSSCQLSAHIKCHPFEPEMVFVEGGTYKMGGSSSVTLTDFWIGKYEVTQAEWGAVMGSNAPSVTFLPSNGLGDSYPAYCVTHTEALAFVTALNQLTGATYALPTEAQWEYAARGGASTHGYTYSGSNTVRDVAWYGDNSGSTSHEVGKKAGNELGIHDMSGNVWEWCSDWYGHTLPSGSNPTGPSSGDSRVVRGGGWGYTAGTCSVASRDHVTPSNRHGIVGFCVVLLP
jgi:formylglycine-generating enzyme required for sulfatase activity